jgi:hypothetical protein
MEASRTTQPKKSHDKEASRVFCGIQKGFRYGDACE